jgi:hypothetical protein
MRFRLLLTSITFFLFVSGCASAPKNIISAPNFLERTKSVKKIGVLIAGSHVFELGAGGSKELNNDWSAQAANNLAKVSVDQLRAAGFDVRIVKVDEQYKSIINKFNEIPLDHLSRYAYSARKLESPISESITDLLNTEGLDALVLVRGTDHVSSGGRQVARVAAAVLLGVGVSSGIAHVEVAMIDRSPAIIYYGHKNEDGKDLREEAGVRDLFAEIAGELKELRGIN